MSPHEHGSRPWLDLLDDEVEPRVVEAMEPDVVVWSTLWPAMADAIIRFDLTPVGAGTALRWTLTTSGDAPPPSKVNHFRYRMNVLINERLRLSFGQ